MVLHKKFEREEEGNRKRNIQGGGGSLFSDRENWRTTRQKRPSVKKRKEKALRLGNENS